MVIAIDGPGGVGKSTISQRVAQALRLPHLDTGSTYRAASLAAVRSEAPIDDAQAVFEAVEAVEILVADETVSIDGRDVTEALRSDAVTTAASRVATYPRVRELVVAMQRDWVAAMGGSAVVEGRDIGTVVFPDALVKIYLTARPEVRAERRSQDAEAAGKTTSQVVQELAARDRRDSTREASPLKPAEDAVVVDTSDLSIDAVVERVLAVHAEADEPLVETLLADHSAEEVSLTRILRGVIRSAEPDLSERINLGWHGIGYHHPDAGYVCGIFPGDRSVRLGFERGTDLADPEGVLTEGGARVRYAVFSNWDETRRRALEELIAEAVAMSGGA